MDRVTFANIIFTTLLLLVASRLGAMVSASKRHFHKGDIPQTALNYTAPLFFTEQAIFWKEKLSKYKKAIVRSANMAKKNYILKEGPFDIWLVCKRESFPKKRWCSFGFCPNEGGGGTCPFFWHLFISAFYVNKRSLFLPKCQ